MEFKRMEGLVGSAPQSFIDRSVPRCPLCGTSNPHWAISQKLQMKMEGNLYLFQCEQCKGILSSSTPDVIGFNSTVLTTTGLLKKLSGKKCSVIYMRIYDIGNNTNLDDCIGKEFSLQELNELAAKKPTWSQNDGGPIAQ